MVDAINKKIYDIEVQIQIIDNKLKEIEIEQVKILNKQINIHYSIKAIQMVQNIVLVPICVEMLRDFDQQKYDESLVIADQILQKEQIYRVFIFKHKIFLHKDNIKEALNMLLQAHTIKPNSAKIQFLIAMKYQMLNDLDNALAYLVKSIQVKLISSRIFELGKKFIELGLLYQLRYEHDLAIVCFTQACDIRTKNKYFIAKMNSFKAQKKYDEALECCQIAILAKPKKSIYYIYKHDLLILQGKQKEAEQLFEEISEIDPFYKLDHFYEKRELTNDRMILEKKQSSVLKKPKKSTLFSKRSQEYFIQYYDAIYYCFTFFFVSLTHRNESELEKKISQFLSMRQIIIIENFKKNILEYLRILFPDVGKLNQDEIAQNLQFWLEQKIKLANEEDIFTCLSKLFHQLVSEETIKNQIIDKISESVQVKLLREAKQTNLSVILRCVSHQFQNADSTMLDPSAGQYGFESGLLLLAYMIMYPKLATDKEDIHTIIWRLFYQKDLSQYYQSQSQIKLQQSQELERQECLIKVLSRSNLHQQPQMQNAVDYLSKIQQKKEQQQ